jgi:multidrug efflux pump
MGGMITATALGVFFVPVFFVVIRSFFKGSKRQQEIAEHHADSAGIAKEKI